MFVTGSCTTATPIDGGRNEGVTKCEEGPDMGGGGSEGRGGAIDAGLAMDAGPVGGLVSPAEAGTEATGSFTEGGRFSGTDIGGISSFAARRNFRVTGFPFEPSLAITERTVATTISQVSRPNNLWSLIDNKLSLILIFPVLSADNGVLWIGWGLNPSTTSVQITTRNMQATNSKKTIRNDVNIFFLCSTSIHHVFITYQ